MLSDVEPEDNVTRDANSDPFTLQAPVNLDISGVRFDNSCIANDTSDIVNLDSGHISDIDIDNTNTSEVLNISTDKPSDKKQESIFGQFFKDAPSFKAKATAPTVTLDSEQVTVLENGWRSKYPEHLTAYSSETYKQLRPGTDSEPLLSVPMLDEFIQFVNKNKKGSRTTKEGFRNPLWSNLETRLRKVHRANQLGILASMATQKKVFDCRALLQKWFDDGNGNITNEQFQEMSDLLLEMFDLSNRSLEQSSRAGGLTHQSRRFVVLQDLNTPQHSQKQWLNLPLSNTGIMGSQFTETLEKWHQMSEQYKTAANQLSNFDSNTKRTSTNTTSSTRGRNTFGRNTHEQRRNQEKHFTGKSNFKRPTTEKPAAVGNNSRKVSSLFRSYHKQ